MPVAPVAVLNIVIYMLKRICTWEKNKIHQTETHQWVQKGIQPWSTAKKPCWCVLQLYYFPFGMRKFLKLHLPDGWFLMGKLPWFFFLESLKPQSLRLKDIRGPDHLQPAQLRYLWSPAQYPKASCWQIIRKLCSQCQWYHACGLANPLPFFDVILLILYKLFIILHSDVVEKQRHGVSKKDRTFKQN